MAIAFDSPALAGQQNNRWDLYRVLAEPVRLRLMALAAEEELAIGELAELLSESQPNISRHVAPLRQAGLVLVRKQGTRTLARFCEDKVTDPVVADALASGRALCEDDGSLARVAEILRARDAVGREFFARPNGTSADRLAGPPPELAAYLAALAPLLPRRELAIDAGTGDGGLLDGLAPTFRKVVAIDRSEAQLARAKERIARRGYKNVTLLEADLTASGLERAGAPREADVVFAVRVLHHAPKPAAVVAALAKHTAAGGALIVLDYARHDDEKMRDAADLWLGFEPSELKKFARAAGFHSCEVTPISSAALGGAGAGPDVHLPWQLMVAKKKQQQ